MKPVMMTMSGEEEMKKKRYRQMMVELFAAVDALTETVPEATDRMAKMANDELSLEKDQVGAWTSTNIREIWPGRPETFYDNLTQETMVKFSKPNNTNNKDENCIPISVTFTPVSSSFTSI